MVIVKKYHYYEMTMTEGSYIARILKIHLNEALRTALARRPVFCIIRVWNHEHYEQVMPFSEWLL